VEEILTERCIYIAYTMLKNTGSNSQLLSLHYRKISTEDFFGDQWI
jgi:hypothetical protein